MIWGLPLFSETTKAKYTGSRFPPSKKNSISNRCAVTFPWSCWSYWTLIWRQGPLGSPVSGGLEISSLGLRGSMTSPTLWRYPAMNQSRLYIIRMGWKVCVLGCFFFLMGGSWSSFCSAPAKQNHSPQKLDGARVVNVVRARIGS